MTENRSAGMSLFDLLAREWIVDAGIAQSTFSRDDSAVLFRTLSGKVAMVSTKDAESPGSRTRIEGDTGRTTIRQRRNPVPAPRIATAMVSSQLPVVRFGQGGFAAVDTEGAVQLITSRGHCIEKVRPDGFAISSLCGDDEGDTLAVAFQSRVSVYRTATMDVRAEVRRDRPVRCMALDPTLRTLAVRDDECMELVDIGGSGDFSGKKFPGKIEGVRNVTRMTWDSSGRYLACASSDKAFHVVDTDAGTIQRVDNYPSHVGVVDFCETGKALVTSGAYRLAGWAIDDLPQGEHPGTPLTTGKAGLVIIDTIAAHPSRSLVASGYASGLVTISCIGTTQELMVHREHSSRVTSLMWSNDGEHLAIGFSSGKAAVVSFPDRFFK